MPIEWILLLLPLAAATGWYSGRSWSNKSLLKQQNKLSHRYIIGLNYLLNEQPDKAIDTFIHLLEVDSDTVETHLALGSLFRKRGEVDRALRLHQNIIARPALSAELRQLALFEMGMDYLTAGVLDRAEHIFEDLKTNPSYRLQSLQQLLNIHQATKDWEQAVATVKELQYHSKVDMHVETAHFYCELAQQEIDKTHLSIASGLLRKAGKIDKKSVRVSLMQAGVEIKQHYWKEALNSYKKILKQDIHFFSEALNGLEKCFDALNIPGAYQKLLLEAVEKGAGSTVLLAAANCIRSNEGDVAAAEYLTGNLRASPSLRGLQALIELHVMHASEKGRDSLILLQELVDELLNTKPGYRCENCGFESRQLYWNCPGCQHWGTVKPILGIEGE